MTHLSPPPPEPPSPPPPPPPPDDDLNVALSAVEAVQAAIRRADTKAVALAGLQCSIMGVALGATDRLGSAWADPGTRAWTVVLVIGLLAGAGTATGLLGAALWPRLHDDDAQNRFAFPALAARAAPPDRAPGLERDDAWRLAMRLSGTAVRKYRLIRAALWPAAMCAASIIGWLYLAACAQ